MRDDFLEMARDLLAQRFTVEELLDYMDITVEEFLDAFPDKWERNKELLNEVIEVGDGSQE